jgi:hypothetical protein
MGLMVSYNLSWSQAQNQLVSQAEKAIFSLLKSKKPFGYFPSKELFQLFDTMIKPVLNYGSQVWGYQYCNNIEKVQNNFCRKHLHLNKTINTCIALGECGRQPLCVTYIVNCIKYWCKLLTMPSYRYPKQCYLMLKKLDDVERICWATKIKIILFYYGYGVVWISQNIGNIDLFVSQFKERLSIHYNQCWKDDLNSASRCYHYKQFKSLLDIESYLTLELPFKFKKALTKFRCSNHSFMIETGRHNNIPLHERFCQFCLYLLNVNTMPFLYVHNIMKREISIYIHGIQATQELKTFIIFSKTLMNTLLEG